MPIPHSFIIVKGQPKALLIEKIDLVEHGVYAIKYKNSPKTYHYRYSDVVCLQNAVWHDHLHLKVYVRGREQHNVSDVHSFSQGSQTHWRITYENGYAQDFLDGTIKVVKSCLGDEVARNAFEYLKRIAQINELGKDDENGGILPSLYQDIDFIDETLTVAPYLDAEKYKPHSMHSSTLLFPFGCNASQAKAVKNAFEKQISVIQGPPGTGKTQTILNIIANILLRNQTVMVVSNNNSATTNVLEKLQKYGIGFIVAPLGRRENKEHFIENQPTIPQELYSWELSPTDRTKTKQEASLALSKVQNVFSLQEELAECKQEIKDVELEWEHFKSDNNVCEDDYTPKAGVKSKHLIRLWLEYQTLVEDGASGLHQNKFIRWIKLKWLNFVRKYILGIKSPITVSNLQPVITELQAIYFIVRLQELASRISEIESELQLIDADKQTGELTSLSLALLKDKLFDNYRDIKRLVLNETKDIRIHSEEFCKQYPVVLSTTFSARTAIPDQVYDYIIMDEASQVSIETGALALTCAKNAVIVGDTMQLPNVVTEEDRIKLNGIFNEFKVAQGFNCADYSFLQSVCAIIPNVEQTLLREHYRCHPTIINYCNQRFYGGNLLIMTEDHHESNVMTAIKTVPGHHEYNHYNQREIDVVKEEILPQLENLDDVGIIAPYNNQVNQFNQQVHSVEAATIHKYQGREKDTIIMSVTDDQITDFSDDSNLINVAISRAKKRFCLVVSGNEQEHKGNISDLIDYIAYNNLTVTDSKISSIFDYLFSHYTHERMQFLAGHRKISEYDSENITFSLIEKILSDYPELNHLGVFCHTPLRNVIRDWSLLNEQERNYISHYSTHLDFLIINHVTKKPVLAIETDGYTYHNDETEQHQRDLLKNHILEVYGLPLIRLRTNESGEKEKILSALESIINS
jgi:superfamily I DNA and/or RNA helicase/very-short-patch-repair endonuclease